MVKQPKVVINGLWMTYHTLKEEIHAIMDLNLIIYEKEFVSIVGPSGCGKSTLLSLIAGLLRPSRGSITVDGKEIRAPLPSVGYMLQQDYLYEWRTILQNAVLGLEVRGRKNPQSIKRVIDQLTDMGLGDFLHSYPGQLSGGMRQRAALVRTLALEPDLLLLDEPFSALDYQTRLNLEEELGGILHRLGRTVILVTHDIAEAISMSDRVVVMSQRPGTIVADHRLDYANNPSSALAVRETPEFGGYFETIWKELQDHGGERKKL
ncbi:MAG: ABC transporter ATP-binding protein [Limnochordia bacterium]